MMCKCFMTSELTSSLLKTLARDCHHPVFYLSRFMRITSGAGFDADCFAQMP